MKREMGGMPHWVTITLVCVLAALAAYVVWDRSQPSSVPSFTPAAAAIPSATPSPTPSPAAQLEGVVVVGDSYTTGSSLDSGGASRWPAIVGVETLATAGVGYVQGGEEASFVALARDIPADATTVVFFGSRNDMFAEGDEVREAAEQAFSIAQENAPDAELVAIGPPWVDADPPAEILEVRDAVSEAAEAVDARWVDPIAEEWFVDGEDLIGIDGVHPTDEGNAYLAERISAILAAE